MSMTSPAAHPGILAALALPVANHLKTARQTMAVCESSIGGLIAAALVSIPNASAYFGGGTVVYTLAARRQLLGKGALQGYSGIAVVDAAHQIIVEAQAQGKTFSL